MWIKWGFFSHSFPLVDKFSTKPGLSPTCSHMYEIRLLSSSYDIKIRLDSVVMTFLIRLPRSSWRLCPVLF